MNEDRPVLSVTTL